jgi:type II secretory ATPase GspE/PulE/Tfp pilus assembly ATPase PilB-like protein
LQYRLNTLDATSPERAAQVVELLLRDAVARAASDVHFEPTGYSVEVRYRLDGVMQPVAVLDQVLAPNLVARLKVLAELLTYRLDIPQEGSIRDGPECFGADMRVSTFPTIHGEKVVVRIFEARAQELDLDQLGLSAEMLAALTRLLRERTGAILFTGPSGSGKTTTIYACLRHLVRAEGRSRNIVAIEGTAGDRVRFQSRSAQPAAARSRSHHDRRDPRP